MLVALRAWYADLFAHPYSVILEGYTEKSILDETFGFIILSVAEKLESELLYLAGHLRSFTSFRMTIRTWYAMGRIFHYAQNDMGLSGANWNVQTAEVAHFIAEGSTSSSKLRLTYVQHWLISSNVTPDQA